MPYIYKGRFIKQMLNNNKTYENSNLRDVQITFNEGVCRVYKANERELIKYKGAFNFGIGSVGVAHYFQFYNNNISIDRIINVPLNNKIDTQDIVEINDMYYVIRRIQYKDNKKPDYLAISLQRSPFNFIDKTGESNGNE